MNHPIPNTLEQPLPLKKKEEENSSTTTTSSSLSSLDASPESSGQNNSSSSSTISKEIPRPNLLDPMAGKQSLDTPGPDDDGPNNSANPTSPSSTTLEQLKQIADLMWTVPIDFILGKAEKPRRYLFDRCDGTSNYRDQGKRPPCAIFYVPMPVKWFPDLLEQNSVMDRFGKVGCVRPYDNGLRKIIFTIATLCQLIAFALTFYAAFSISKDYNILQATSFTHGVARVYGGRLVETEMRFRGEEYNSMDAAAAAAARFPDTVIDVGLLGVALEGPSFASFDGRVMKWDEFCSFYGGYFDQDQTPGNEHEDGCLDCGQRSKGLVATMIMSLLFSIPSFTTDILRFYPDYDVNCQKFFGAVVSFISMCSSLLTWYGYYKGCVNIFSGSDMAVLEDFSRAPTRAEADLILNLDWEAGYGYHLVVVATVLKIVDVICNLAVPTPEICRDKHEQAMYERVAINRDIEKGQVSAYTPEHVASLRASVMMAHKDWHMSTRKLAQLEAIADDWSDNSDGDDIAHPSTNLMPIGEGEEEESSTSSSQLHKNEAPSFPSPPSMPISSEGEDESTSQFSQSEVPPLASPPLPPLTLRTVAGRATPSPLNRQHKSVYF